MTVTVTAPTPAGEAPVQLVLLEHATAVAGAPPKENTVWPAAGSKPVPANVTDVPPPAGPETGEIELRLEVGVEAENASCAANGLQSQPTAPLADEPTAAYSPTTQTLAGFCGSIAAPS